MALSTFVTDRAQLIKDRAIRPVVTFARFNQAREDFDDGAVGLHAGRNHLFVTVGQSSDFAARTALIPPELKQVVDLLDRKPPAIGRT